MNDAEGSVGGQSGESSANRFHRPRVRIGAVIVVAVAAGVVVWFAIGHDNNSSTPASSTTTTATGVPRIGPLALSPQRMRRLSGSLHQPIYWAGPQRGFRYEFTRTSNGRIYVRYLPAGVNVGDKRSKFLIVVTYPFSGAYRALTAVADNRGDKLAGGGLALVDAKYPKSVHIAYRNVNYQIEVYDPSPRRSRTVALSGQVQPIR